MFGRRIVLFGWLVPFSASAQKFGPEPGPTPSRPGQSPYPKQGQDEGLLRNRTFFVGRWQATDTALGSPIRFDTTFGEDGGFINHMTFPVSGASVSMVGQWSLIGPSSVQLQIRDWQPRQTWNSVERRWVAVQYPSTAVYHYTIVDNRTMVSPGSDQGSRMTWQRMG